MSIKKSIIVILLLLLSVSTFVGCAEDSGPTVPVPVQQGPSSDGQQSTIPKVQEQNPTGKTNDELTPRLAIKKILNKLKDTDTYSVDIDFKFSGPTIAPVTMDIFKYNLASYVKSTEANYLLAMKEVPVNGYTGFIVFLKDGKVNNKQYGPIAHRENADVFYNWLEKLYNGALDGATIDSSTNGYKIKVLASEFYTVLNLQDFTSIINQNSINDYEHRYFVTISTDSQFRIISIDFPSMPIYVEGYYGESSIDGLFVLKYDITSKPFNTDEIDKIIDDYCYDVCGRYPETLDDVGSQE